MTGPRPHAGGATAPGAVPTDGLPARCVDVEYGHLPEDGQPPVVADGWRDARVPHVHLVVRPALVEQVALPEVLERELLKVVVAEAGRQALTASPVGHNDRTDFFA